MSDAADVVVVGAGLSGLECASALVAAGARDIVVVEAGSSAAAPAGTSVAGWDSTHPVHYRRQGAEPVVGGRSLAWHGVVLRLDDWALADPCWPAPVRAALTGGRTGSAGLYDQVERDLEAWAGGSLTSHAPLPDRMSGRLLGSAPARPVPQAVKQNGGDAGWRAYTPLDRCRAWGDGSDRPGRPRIRSASRTVDLTTHGGRVTGVRVLDVRTRRVGTVSARSVVLAAGTLENTRLVAQLTGAHTDRLRSFPGLNDHLVQGFVVQLAASALGQRQPEEAFGYAAGGAARRSNLFARVRPVPGADDAVLLDVWAMGEQVASELNRVSFPGAGEPPWRGTVTPGVSEADQQVLAGQRRWLREVWAGVVGGNTTGSGRLRCCDFFDAPRTFDQAMSRLARSPRRTPVGYSWPLGTVDHEAGTLPLGGRHVDETGRLRAVAGVHVVGPATFPRSGAANPSLTTLALARWTAAGLVGA